MLGLRRFSELGLTTRTTLTASATVLAGLALFGLLLCGTRNQRGHTREAAGASEVLLALERVRGLALETQAGTRGYLITREPQFLEPWRHARDRARSANRRLLELVASEPLSSTAARAIVVRIESLIVDWQQPLLR